MFQASLLLFLCFPFALYPCGCSCHPLLLCSCSLATLVSPLCDFPLLRILFHVLFLLLRILFQVPFLFLLFSFVSLSVAFSSTVAPQKSPNVWDQASAVRAFSP